MPPEEIIREPRQVVALPKVASRVDGLDVVLHGGLPEGAPRSSGAAQDAAEQHGPRVLYRGAVAGSRVSWSSSRKGPQPCARMPSPWAGTWRPWSRKEISLLEGFLDPAAVLSGDFDLQALLAVIGGQAQALGAKRVVLDAVDMLTRLFDDPRRERKELYALHRWLLNSGDDSDPHPKGGRRSEAHPSYTFLDFLADA